MPIKLRNSLFNRFLVSPWGKVLLVLLALAITGGAGTFTYFYVKYSRITDEKLKAGPFANMSLLYAAPRQVLLGEQASGEDIAAYLRRCGYSESNSSRVGWYRVRPDAVEVNPGPDAYDPEGAVIKIQGGRVTQIISLRDHAERTQFLLEPELITNLFDQKREKRRIVHFDDIPKVMVEAVLSAEDKHFFQHAGFDPVGIVRAAFVDLKDRRANQGSSTLTMQLARTQWLSNERTWRRKAAEVLITMHLEQKLTKQQIFEYYANSIYLGNQGSFSINGFGEGAQVYFAKELSQVTLPEAAMMAGLIQSRRWDPFRHPEQAKTRRNQVLKNMRENGYINEREYEEAAASPLTVKRGMQESSDAPYFVDLVNNTLQSRFQDQDFQNGALRVYTTLDMNLQRDAVEAVRTAIVETDKQWKRRSKIYGTDEFPLAQVCLIALDTQTGGVLAFVAGRSYGASQLDHCLANRQPGSSFKPFVYTAAMSTALDNQGGPVLTPATTVVDEPTTFWFEQQPPYQPADFEDKYRNAAVTLREALAHSMNVPAVKVAEMVGYDKVAQVARAVGLNRNIKPTPAIALGAYEVMPMEIAGAYTVFPNRGQLLQTNFIQTIRNAQDNTIFEAHPERRQAIDPRVAYVVENMMEEVLRSGTGAGVHGRGFNLPAAGKTGTSFDGWFAGFTSRILCVVWMGFDDNRDFKLEGARSALPIWVEFMKRAHQHPEYKNVHPFEAPDGIVTAEIDADTGELATPACSNVRSEVFIAGTQPVQSCHLHGSGRTHIASWEPVQTSPQPPPLISADGRPPDIAAAARPPDSQNPRSISVTPPAPQQSQTEKKRGFWGHVKDIFK